MFKSNLHKAINLNFSNPTFLSFGYFNCKMYSKYAHSNYICVCFVTKEKHGNQIEGWTPLGVCYTARQLSKKHIVHITFGHIMVSKQQNINTASSRRDLVLEL